MALLINLFKCLASIIIGISTTGIMLFSINRSLGMIGLISNTNKYDTSEKRSIIIDTASLMGCGGLISCAIYMSYTNANDIIHIMDDLSVMKNTLQPDNMSEFVYKSSELIYAGLTFASGINILIKMIPFADTQTTGLSTHPYFTQQTNEQTNKLANE